MKNLILATAIASLTATSAVTAAPLYENDNLSVNLNGDLQVQLYQEIGADKDLDVNYDDLQLNLGTEYKLNNNMTAFGQLNLDWNAQGDSDAGTNVVDQAYVGLKTGAISTSIGNQYWGSDDFGIEKAIEMNGGTAFDNTGGSDTIKVAYDSKRFGAVLSHDLEVEDDESVIDLALTSTFGPANVGVTYQDYQASAAADSVETTGVMASVDLGRTNVGLDYSTNDSVDYTNAAVGFPIAGKTSGAVGVTLAAPDEGDDVVQWYANATHKLHSNVSVFAEIGDNDEDETDLGYLAGMQVKF